jgi:hypothetical protein
MAWVIWRQHRLALCGVAALLGALALCLWIVGLHVHHAYAEATACRPTGSFACEGLIGRFDGIDNVLSNGYVLQAVPALIGAFVGAPVLARELETGTFRYAWTQGFGPWRWTLAKLVALAVVVAAAAGVLSVLLSWYYEPFFHPYFAGGPISLTTESSPLARGLFDLRGVAFAAWTLVAFAIGGLAGMLIRRVIPAILATLVAYAGLAFATGAYLRQHYLPALLTSRLNVPASAWIVSQRWTTTAGRPVSLSVLSRVLQAGGPAIAGKGGVPQSLGSWQYLAQHGYTRWTTYQPAGRFWTFQWIEGGWLLALSVLLLATTVWLVRRRGRPKRRQGLRPGAAGRRRLRRAALTAGAVLAVAAALAGCGGGSSSSGVAHLSTGTSGGSSASAGGSSSTESDAGTQQKLVAYAQCMRTHGVPDFPDPTSGEGNTKQAAIRAFKQVSGSQVDAAQTACRHLAPNGGQPSRAQIAQRIADLLAFARCMRAHSFPNFPDPTSGGQVTHAMLAKAGISVHQPGVLPAADACVAVTHGALTREAIARFAAGQ